MYFGLELGPFIGISVSLGLFSILLLVLVIYIIRKYFFNTSPVASAYYGPGYAENRLFEDPLLFKRDTPIPSY